MLFSIALNKYIYLSIYANRAMFLDILTWIMSPHGTLLWKLAYSPICDMPCSARLLRMPILSMITFLVLYLSSSFQVKGTVHKVSFFYLQFLVENRQQWEISFNISKLQPFKFLNRPTIIHMRNLTSRTTHKQGLRS